MFLFPRHLYKEQVSDTGILIVEGWLPENVLKKAIEIFDCGDYKIMATTGNKMPEEVLMHSYGKLIFNLKELLYNHLNKKVNIIKVSAYGSKADREYPHFQLFLNDSLTGDSYVHRNKKEYVFYTDKNLKDIRTLVIYFDNDGFTNWRDRNLYIDYIMIEDIKIRSRSNVSYYDINRVDDIEEYSPGFDSEAEYSAFILKYLGFKDSVVVLPSQRTKFSRTYSCALAFKEWYLKSSFKDKPVNIVSLGPHSRRTWMVYKKVLGKNVNVGIIALNNEAYNMNNWWKSLAGIKDTIHEMVSYIYTLAILPFLSKELKE